MWYLNKTSCLYIFYNKKENQKIILSRFSDIHPRKKVTQRETSYLTIYNTLGFVEERTLPRIDDVNFMILNTYYSNWVHFEKLIQAKMLISIKFPFQRYIILYVLEQKKKKKSKKMLTSAVPWTWKISSVAYTDHLCKFSYFCHNLHDNLIFLT